MYTARRMLAPEIQQYAKVPGTGLFCVEAQSGQIVAPKLSWREACAKAAELNAHHTEQPLAA